MKIQVISRNVGYALLVSALFMFLSRGAMTVPLRL